jgi:hypothetical protein
MTPFRVFLSAAMLFAVSMPARAAVLREATGLVQVRQSGGDSWRPAGKTPRPLGEGDGIRTGFNAKARVELHGGTVLTAEGNAHVSIEVDAPGHTNIHTLFGTVRMIADAPRGRSVSVRTPTCVVRARGERVLVRVTVAGGGSTTVEVEEGVAGVEDNRGASVILRRDQRIEVDLAGVHEPTAAPTPVQARKTDFMALMRRELGFELGRDADFAAASREARRAEREMGRLLTDADGKRVRVEEYVVRPTGTRLALVVMNGRADGLSYYSWDGTFDVALPRNLEPVLAGLAGGAAATAWTVTDFTMTRADGRGALIEKGSGGHQVDLNGNADPLDDVAGGGTAFRTVYDRFGVYADGVLKRGFTGVALQAYSDAAASTTNDPLTGALLGAALPVSVISTTFPDGASARQVRLETYGDGTSLVRETLSLEFGGGAGPRAGFGSPDRNAEDRTTFGGRTIRIVLPSNAAGATRQLW